MTAQEGRLLGVGSDFASALADAEPSWFTLPAEDADVPEPLRVALDGFDAGERPAALAAADWLRGRALACHETSRTRLLLAGGRIAGFYSLASAQVALSQSDRRRAGLDPVRVPAALVTWIAKDRRSAIDGKVLLLHAAGTARRAAELQATAVLLVDPYDEQTERMWRERFGFRRSAEAGTPKRLWLALRASD